MQVNDSEDREMVLVGHAYVISEASVVLARVFSKPYRTQRQARQIAYQIFLDPQSYLAACTELQVPGVVNLKAPVDGSI